MTDDPDNHETLAPQAEPAQPERRHDLAWVFVGKSGIRLPWALLIFIVLVGAIQIGIVLALKSQGLHSRDLAGDPDSAMGVILGLAPGVASVLGATLIMAAIERRWPADYGFALRGMITRFLYGILVGAGVLSALVGTLWGLGALSFEGLALQGDEIWRQGLLWAGACLMIGLLEESALRGFLLARIARTTGFFWAALLTSLLFSAAHFSNAGESMIGLASAGLVAVIFCFSIWKTGSLWWAVGFHAAWNWAQSYLFGVGDSGSLASGALMVSQTHGPAWLSGGATGPEGSALVFAALAVSALLVHFGPGRPRGRETLAPPPLAVQAEAETQAHQA